MMILPNLLKHARVLLMTLLLTMMIGFGCDEQRPASQPTQEQGHEHAADEGDHDEATHSDDAHDEHAHDAHGDDAGDPHDGHGHGDGHDEGPVVIDAHELEEFGIELRTAETGTLASVLRLPGEVVFNPDRVAHVTPRVPGVARRVDRGIGDEVEPGEVLAVLDSRELARAKSAYLAAQATLELARASFEREKRLYEQQIAPEAEFLHARQALREAQIDLQLAERELHALGLNEQQVASLPDEADESLTRYELAAPIAGTIIERHLTRGEVIAVQPADPPFVIASTDTVWVQLTVYPKDLGRVRPGLEARITADDTDAAATGTIGYVSLHIREGTRTALARVVLNNEDGTWRPGQFVTARVRLPDTQAHVVVPASALQTVDGQTVVYVRTPEGFEPRSVELGRRNRERVEVRSGLDAGERYAVTNTFTLKAEQGRGLLEHAGHAH